MGFLDLLKDIAERAAKGVAVGAALPICGAVGTVTSGCAAGGAVVGAVAVVADHFLGEDDDDG